MFIATSNAASGLFLAVVQNAVGVALLFAFAPFGVIGIAFARLAHVVVWPLRLFVLHRVAGVDVLRYVMQTLRCTAAAAPVLGLLLLLQSTPWADAPATLWTFLMPSGAIAVAVYSVFVWIFAGPENRTVLRSVGQDVKRRLSRNRVDEPVTIS
jgi:hypothetical protein